LIATSWQLMANNISCCAKKKPTTKIGKKKKYRPKKKWSDHFYPVNPQKEMIKYIHYPRDGIQPLNHFLSNFKIQRTDMIFEKEKEMYL
jgi:hypothetical protein